MGPTAWDPKPSTVHTGCPGFDGSRASAGQWKWSPGASQRGGDGCCSNPQNAQPWRHFQGSEGHSRMCHRCLQAAWSGCPLSWLRAAGMSFAPLKVPKITLASACQLIQLGPLRLSTGRQLHQCHWYQTGLQVGSSGVAWRCARHTIHQHLRRISAMETLRPCCVAGEQRAVPDSQSSASSANDAL